MSSATVFPAAQSIAELLQGSALWPVLIVITSIGFGGLAFALVLKLRRRESTTHRDLRTVLADAERRLTTRREPEIDRRLVAQSIVALKAADHDGCIELPAAATEALHAGLCHYLGREPPSGSAALEEALRAQSRSTARSSTGWLSPHRSAASHLDAMGHLLGFGIRLAPDWLAPTHADAGSGEGASKRSSRWAHRLRRWSDLQRTLVVWLLGTNLTIVAVVSAWFMAVPTNDARDDDSSGVALPDLRDLGSDAGEASPSKRKTTSDPWATQHRVGDLPGTVVMAPHGIAGVDSFAPLDEHARDLVAAGYRFCVRYVPLRHDDRRRAFLTRQEAQTILRAGLALMLVQNGAEWRDRAPSAKLGERHGRVAAESARALGYPRSAVIFVDIEGVRMGDAASVKAYAEAWYQAVAPDFAPGIYVGPNIKLNAQELSSLPFEHFWKSGARVPTPSPRGYQMLQHHQVWIGGQEFDYNHTVNAFGDSVRWLQPEAWEPAKVTPLAPK